MQQGEDATVDTVTSALPVEDEVSDAEKRSALWLTNGSHAVNHFQNGIVSFMYVDIMKEFGIGYVELGILVAVRNAIGSILQGSFGLITPFARKTRLLGLGNIIMGIGVAISGFAGSFFAFGAGRTVVEAGSAAQHPVGASFLAGHFPKNRGTILSLNVSFAGIGGFAAPLLAPLMVVALGWRQTLLIMSILSVIIGIGYLILSRLYPRSPVDQANSQSGTSSKGKLKEGLRNYKIVLRNRNMLVVSSVMMVGAAGRGGGINDTYLIPHLVKDLGLVLGVAGLAKAAQQAGGIVGPIGFGWLSDRISRKRVLQASLLLSAIGSWVVAWMGPSLIPLFISLFIYGVFTHSRMTLTQALIADSVEESERDAAFSAFFLIGFISVPIWGITTGVMMEFFGFSVAFSVIAFTYIIGMFLMSFVQENPRVPA
ncbi:MAG: MFS transporter [Chloroflexi bacterium]|nr:MFS transporter [Chloroflexota bacterium]